MVSKRTGTIIAVVMAVLFGFAGLFTCVGGVLTVPGSTFPYEVSGWVWFGANICSGLSFLALPVVFYIILVANNRQAPDIRDAPKE